MRAAPRAIVIIARVAINGGVLNLVIIIPFNTLHATPTAIATIKAIRSEPVILYEEMESTPASASTEPEDKSSIPLIISTVCPKARIVPTEICADTFFRFSVDTKFSFAIQLIIKRAASTK
jgi:hypothetical protein